MMRINICNKSGRQGFTLIELLVTIGLMAAVITLSIAAFTRPGEAARMDIALRTLRQTVSLARQSAITSREETFVVFVNTGTSGPAVDADMRRRAFSVYAKPEEGEMRRIHEWVYLPEGIIFVEASLNSLDRHNFPDLNDAAVIAFKRRGGLASGATTKHIDLRQGAVTEAGDVIETYDDHTGRIAVNGLTGLARVQRDI